MTSTTRQQSFQTPGPTRVYVESGKGSVRVHATETDQTRVQVAGTRAHEVQISELDGLISVVAPRPSAGFWPREDQRLDIVVDLPRSSDVSVRTGSADIVLAGEVAVTDLKSGSGDISAERLAGPGRLETGSGDIRVERAESEVRIKSGSGDVVVPLSLGALAVSTGSGDVRVEDAQGPLVVKTGSGDLAVARAQDDLSYSTGSGDVQVGSAQRGRISLKGASGDVRIGVPAGTPVWTDIASVTGDVRSDLEPTGAPVEGQEHLEVRAKTATGSIVLTQV